MGDIKFDASFASSIRTKLSSVESTVEKAKNRTKSAHAVLWADEALTNAFSKSLIAEINSAAGKMKKQQELIAQYSAAMKSVEQDLPSADSDSAKTAIKKIIAWTWFVSGATPIIGLPAAIGGILWDHYHSSSSVVSGQASSARSVGDAAANVGKTTVDQAAEAAQKVIDETPQYVPFSEASIHDYSEGVTRGEIRYVNQRPATVLNEDVDPSTGLRQGWREMDLIPGSDSYLDHQCNWACESMAFSYLGVDQPPGTMHDTETLRSFELALGANDGYSASFDAVDGTADITVHSNGWGASFDRNYLDTLVENFAQDGGRGSQSPVMLHYSDGSNMHWILLTGKNADGTYHAIGPWSNPDGLNERLGFDVAISDNGTVSGSGFSGCDGSRRVDCIGQYTRTN